MNNSNNLIPQSSLYVDDSDGTNQSLDIMTNNYANNPTVKKVIKNEKK